MSDRWEPGDDGGERSEWARPDVQPGSTPDPTPPADRPRMVEPPLTLETEAAVQSRRGFGGRVLAGVLGVLVLLGGLGFAATQLGSSGPGSAEEAVRALLDATSDEDVLGVLAALDPGERDALRPPVEDLVGELQRLEVLAPGFDLASIGGIDLEFTDVQLRSEPVRDDLVRVYFTGGTVSGSLDGDQIPVGDFVRDTLDRFGVDISELDESDSNPITEDDDTFLVARDGGDGWRVSIGYTAAEAARLDAGVPLSGDRIAPIGADSPEAAVEGMVGAVADLDLAGMIARLNPGEMRALQDYAFLFLDEVQRSLDQEAEAVDVTIDDLSLSSETDGDRASVFVETFAVTVTYEDQSVSVSTDGECFTVEMEGFDAEELEGFPFGDGPVCTDDLNDLYSDLYGFDASELDVPEFPPTPTPELGITTIRVDGQWFVSPFGTVLDGVVDGLRVLERSHLDAIVDFVEPFFGGFLFGAEETFSEVGESLDESYIPEPPGGELDGIEDGFTEFSTTTQLGGTQFGSGFGSVEDHSALHSLALSITGEDITAKCTVVGLIDRHDPQEAHLLYELVDSWQYDYEPSPEALRALHLAAEHCMAGTGTGG